jgi:hypothetical protein
MLTAYKVAALAVMQRLSEQHPEDLEILKNIKRGETGYYTGTYDRVEKILALLKIPATKNPSMYAMGQRIIFVNCSSVFKTGMAKRLAEWVERGGWLVSSDWALHEIISKAFPNTVQKQDGKSGDEVVSVEPALDSLWSGVVVLGADPQWWLESSSYPIEVLDRERVTIEAASHDLLCRYQAPAVAVSFDWGKGHVFHVISHFWCKRSRVPTPRHSGPAIEFLEVGMNLSEESIGEIFRKAKVDPSELNFAEMQSAATSTELIAQLCIRAVKANSQPEPAKVFNRLFS